MEAKSNNGRGGRRWGRRMTIGALVAGLGMTGVALAHGGPGGEGHGPGHRHGARAHDPAKMQAFMEQRLRKSFAEVGANETQANQAVEIMRAARNDLQGLREQARGARQASMKILAAPTVDRAQLEVLRLQQVEVHNQVTKRMNQAFADVADILTPEQRAKFAERFQRRMGEWRGPGVAG